MKHIILFLLLSVISFGVQAQKSGKPKLVVGIVIDQMCYEYLYRHKEKFGSEGFNLLMEKGTNCKNTLYNYVPTFTGPGHASIYSGTTPENHGIVANEWFERESGKVVNCVEDFSVKSVGTDSEDGLCSPKNLKTLTITDQLKVTYPNAKVVSMSIKDRGAILPGGHMSDGSYWYDYATGKFVTSSFFKTELPQWVSDFNAKNQVDNYLKQTWNTYYDISTYKESGPDDSPYEHLLTGKTSPTFPYDLKEMTKGVSDYSLFTTTPFANTYLTDFAINSIQSEQLGQDSQTDFLCISYSTPDIAGHAFGSYSVELEDIYIRLDLDIAALIKKLESEVGKDGFTMFITADHAVVPVPQFLIDNNMPGGYVFLNDKMTVLENKIQEIYGHDLILEQENLNIYLDHRKIDSLNISRSQLETLIAAEILKWEGVKRAFTSQQIANGNADDEWLNMVRRGYHHKESGDIIFILEPGYLPKSVDSEKARKGTSHGSAFNYDTHVPLLWYGNGIKSCDIYRTIQITDISATLVHILNLQRPGAMTGEPITEILKCKKRR